MNAQEEDIREMVTDRPDQTESSMVVGKNYFQLETGFAYENTDSGDLTRENFTYNTSLLRYGLLDNLELRLGLDFMKEKTGSYRLAGTGPLLLGAKVALVEEKKWIPSIALLGHANLPFAASKDFRPEKTGVDFRFSFSHTLSEKSGLAYNVGAEWLEDATTASYIYTLSYGREIIVDFGFYAEVYGDFTENDSPGHYWNVGLTYLLAYNFQIDTYAGTGFGNNQNLLAGAGISFRLPN